MNEQTKQPHDSDESTRPEAAGQHEPATRPGEEDAVRQYREITSDPRMHEESPATDEESAPPQPQQSGGEPAAPETQATGSRSHPVEPSTEDSSTSAAQSGIDEQVSDGDQPAASEQQARDELRAAEGGTSAGGTRPSHRNIKIGSQRDATGGKGRSRPKAKPQRLKKPEEEAAREARTERNRPKTAVPNIREELSDDMQREFEMAMAGGELDTLLVGAADAAKQLEEGSEQQGQVLSIREENVFVDLGGRDQGIVSLKQFPEPPQIGSQVTIRVTGFNADDGLYEAVLPGAAIDVADWSSLSEGAIVDAVVTGHNKGGLDVEVNKIRGFIPISQIALFRVDDLEQFNGEKMTCVVTEANAEKRNLVLSRRAMLEREREEKREKLLEELQVGQIRQGVVRKLEKFGAFVDIGGIDGLVHISQLSWDHVRHPSDVLEVGQQIRVRIEKIDPASGKIGLGYRDLFESPWLKAVENYPTGATVEGTVSKVADFGAFVKLEPGIEGLVHVSEIAHHRVNRVLDYLKEGDRVSAKVLSIDPEKQRMSLSIKALAARPEQAKSSKPQEQEPEDTPQARQLRQQAEAATLKGGVNEPSGGERFGLKW